MAKRISHENVGEVFTLFFTGENKKENHLLTSFNGFQDAPDSWRATFSAMSLTPGVYGTSFEAYRVKGHWVYGSFAEVLRSVDY
jgi:hypothetical protein